MDADDARKAGGTVEVRDLTGLERGDSPKSPGLILLTVEQLNEIVHALPKVRSLGSGPGITFHPYGEQMLGVPRCLGPDPTCRPTPAGAGDGLSWVCRCGDTDEKGDGGGGPDRPLGTCRLELTPGVLDRTGPRPRIECVSEQCSAGCRLVWTTKDCATTLGCQCGSPPGLWERIKTFFTGIG